MGFINREMLEGNNQYPILIKSQAAITIEGFLDSAADFDNNEDEEADQEHLLPSIDLNLLISDYIQSTPYKLLEIQLDYSKKYPSI